MAFQIPRFQFEQIVDGMRFADSYPAFLSIWMGPNRSLWVQHVLTISDMTDEEREMFDYGAQHPHTFVGNPRIAIGAPDWEVFDSEGRYLGEVTLPTRFEPMQFDGDHIYGVRRDELDVEFVMRLKVVER